jgi:hypothetical protein
MIYMTTAASGLTAEEYCTRFLVGGKSVSSKTIIRRCENGQLRHHAEKFPDEHGPWIIIVPDVVEEVKTAKKEGVSLNVKHFSWR